MGRSTVLALGVLLGLAGAARAAEIYEYRVIHPAYGDIGTYTNIVDRLGDATEVRSEMKIRVRILGITVYRQEAQRTERWQGQQFVSFDGVTVTNGDRLEVHGLARDGAFAITTPHGTTLAPVNIHPSNPWSAMVLMFLNLVILPDMSGPSPSSVKTLPALSKEPVMIMGDGPMLSIQVLKYFFLTLS
jgi:hypothetical protein